MLKTFTKNNNALPWAPKSGACIKQKPEPGMQTTLDDGETVADAELEDVNKELDTPEADAVETTFEDGARVGVLVNEDEYIMLLEGWSVLDAVDDAPKLDLVW